MTDPSGLIPVSEAPEERHTPMHLRYFHLLRSNRNFRRLWLAQLISEIGDWFYSLAVYDLLLEFTNSGKAVSWAIILQTLPWFFMTPLAGHIVDRFPRRRLMILADLVRGFVVLGLLLVRGRSEVWLVYVLLGAEVVFASLFEPARHALLPNLTREEELLPANALSSATWSLALTIGAGLGGAVTALAGRDVSFVVNSLSFFASAVLLARVRSAEPHLVHAGRAHEGKPSSSRANSLKEGAEYLVQNPKVVALILAKTGLGILGGVLLILTVFGERVFALHGRGALSMGFLYMARGVGAGIGPLIGDHLTRGRENRMWKSISLGFFLIGTSYAWFSRAPTLPLAALAVMCAHVGGSNVWVMTTTLLQLNTTDRFRGRVFSLDFGMNMLANSTSNYLIGVGLDTWKYSARQLALTLGFLLMLPGLFWLPVQAKWAKKAGAGD